MRIAQRMVSRNYRKTLNNSLAKQAASLERSDSGLKFSKLSDNVGDGSRAMHIQEQRYQANQHLDNVENLYEEMKSVDSNMASIHSVLQNIQERMLMGMSQDYGESARKVIAQEISSKKDQILQFTNNQFGGKYLFSGTNNSVAPFTVSQDGKLAYNGIEVENIYKDKTTGQYMYVKEYEEIQATDGNGNPAVDDEGNPVMIRVPKETAVVPNSQDTYADVGLGLKIADNTNVDTRTAFQVSFSGLTIMGCGELNNPDFVIGNKGTKVPTNIYDTLTKVSEVLSTEPPDENALDDLFTQVVNLTDQMGMTRTDLGTRMQFLEKTQERLEDDIDNMTELETKLISSDPAEEAMKMKECEYVWLAVMQLGSKVLPASLLDFMS